MREVYYSALEKQGGAQLAAPRFAAGEGIDAALAAPVYLRDKVAFTTQELENR